MATISERIAEAMAHNHLKQTDLVERSGINKGALSSYISGRYEPKQRNIYKLAKALNVSEAWLMGLDVPMQRITETPAIPTQRTLKGVRIPVLGQVHAGIPIDAYEDILDYEEISSEMAFDGEYFGLQVKGDSMEPKFSEGDVVIVRKQEDAECGDIVIALVNGGESTIKKLIKYDGGGIALVASNPLYAPMQFTEADIAEKPVTIVGKVVELRAKF